MKKSYFDYLNPWGKFILRESLKPHVQLVMFHLLFENNRQNNSGTFTLTDRELIDRTGYTPKQISEAKKRLMEFGFIVCETDPDAPRKATRYVMIAKSGSKIDSKIDSKTDSKTERGNENPIYTRTRARTRKTSRPQEVEKKEKEKKETLEVVRKKDEPEVRKDKTPDFSAWADLAGQEEEDPFAFLKAAQVPKPDETSSTEESDKKQWVKEEPSETEPTLDEPDFTEALKEYVSEVTLPSTTEEPTGQEGGKPDWTIETKPKGGNQNDENADSADNAADGIPAGIDDSVRRDDGGQAGTGTEGLAGQLQGVVAENKARTRCGESGRNQRRRRARAKAGKLCGTHSAGVASRRVRTCGALSVFSRALLHAVQLRRRAG